MKRKKRFIPKLFVIILSIVLVIISSKVIFNKLQNDEEMMNYYQIKKERCEFLRHVAEETVENGKGINTKKIPNDEIQYRIYNDEENVIFYYYLKDVEASDNKYDAKITLSNEYSIIKEEYGIEIESLNEYIRLYKYGNKVISVVLAIAFVIGIYVVIGILFILISKLIIRKIKKLFVDNR